MMIFQIQKFRQALVISFGISAFLVAAANATVSSDLNLPGIQSVIVASSQSAPQRGLNTLDSAQDAMPGHSWIAAFPSPALLASGTNWGAVFPVIGLIAAVAVTQLLRRRRIAQLRASSSAGQ